MLCFHIYILIHVARGGNIYLNSSTVDQGNMGSMFLHTFIHELGHAIGLSHPHDGTVLMPGVDKDKPFELGTYKSNQLFFSQMSYAEISLNNPYKPSNQSKRWISIHLDYLN